MARKLDEFEDVVKIGEGTYGKVYRCVSSFCSSQTKRPKSSTL